MSNTTYIKSFLVTVAASGTPVQATSYAIPEGVEVLVTASTGNTGTVTVGSTSAEAIYTSTNNKPLEAGQAVGYQVRDTQILWFDSTVSADTINVSFEYELI